MRLARALIKETSSSSVKMSTGNSFEQEGRESNKRKRKRKRRLFVIRYYSGTSPAKPRQRRAAQCRGFHFHSAGISP